MKTFLRGTHFLEEAIVPAAPDPHDEEEKERYVTRQLWWALIGLVLFALAMLFGWGGAQAANARSDSALFAPTADLAHALDRARREGLRGVAVLYAAPHDLARDAPPRPPARERTGAPRCAPGRCPVTRSTLDNISQTSRKVAEIADANVAAAGAAIKSSSSQQSSEPPARPPEGDPSSSTRRERRQGASRFFVDPRAAGKVVPFVLKSPPTRASGLAMPQIKYTGRIE